MSEISGKSILVIDDELFITKIIGSILSKEFDYDVSIANSFTEAKTRINNLHPDIIFLDVNLGDGNGYDLLREIKEKEKPAPYVVMMSAYEKEQEQKDSLEKGADFFMSKPFGRPTVINIIKDIISDSK